MNTRTSRFSALLFAIGGLSSSEAAAPSPKRLTFWDLQIGATAASLPADAFTGYACGSNGGAPGRALSGWTDFRQCRPESNGLREVSFRYDDELEFIARANRDEMSAAKYGGTTIYDMPIIASGLFDDNGKLRGLRAITDPRADLATRKRAYALSNFLLNRFDGLKCDDLPARDGETPVGSEFVKTLCVGETSDFHVVIESHFFRKAGQNERSATTGQNAVGAWESATRLEILQKP